MAFAKTRRTTLLVLTVLLGSFSLVSYAPGGSFRLPAGVVAFQRTEERSAVRAGMELEAAGLWPEAIEHYEEALKDQPDAEDLKNGLRRSKIHFAIERRYADGSFESTLLPMSRAEALDLFDEVLRQIRGNYVDSLPPTPLVAHGTESFYVALINEKFRSRHLPNASEAQIEQMKAILRDRYWNKPVADGYAARRLISEVCESARTLLGLSPSAVVMEYVFGACNALDDYSSYLTPHRWNDLQGNIDGEFVGLGIEMKAELGKGMLLVNVLADSPAEEGGMKPGGHVVRIDGTDCRDMTTDEAARLLRGMPGSRVRLVIEEPTGETWDGLFARRAVHVKSIPVAKMIDRSNGIAYIRMTGFQRSTVSELDGALADLNRQGMRSLIWDLRGNPGGLLTTAAEVLDRFIDRGVLVSTRGRTLDQNWSPSAHRGGTYRLPLVLIVDGDSASASEIVAGAIQDHNRGVVVGRRTFGKWSVQTLITVSHASALRLTTARFYSPHGRNLSHVGLEPDVFVEQPHDETVYYRATRTVDLDRDADLQKAVEILHGQLSRR